MDYSPPTEAIKAAGVQLRERQVNHYNVRLVRLQLLAERCRIARELAEDKLRALAPKDKDLTELDRTLQVGAAVAHIQQDLDVLLGLEQLLAELSISSNN